MKTLLVLLAIGATLTFPQDGGAASPGPAAAA